MLVQYIPYSSTTTVPLVLLAGTLELNIKKYLCPVRESRAARYVEFSPCLRALVDRGRQMLFDHEAEDRLQYVTAVVCECGCNYSGGVELEGG